MKCDTCGKFSHHLIPVWENSVCPGIDRECCERCAPYDAIKAYERMTGRTVLERETR